MGAISFVKFAFIFLVISPICTELSKGIYLKEEFNSNDEFQRDWIVSKSTVSDTDETLKYQGKWEVFQSTDGQYSEDTGLFAHESSKHYCTSRKLSKDFKFSGSPLIFQYEVKFPSQMSCGGGYIKLLSNNELNNDLSQIKDNSPYTIMFGPDVCGDNKKIHFIFRHLNPKTKKYEEKHLNQPDSSKFVHIFTDGRFHHFLLQINPDNSFLIKLDGSVISSGSLLNDFTPSVNPVEFIDDPNDKKPNDWDDRVKIPDINAVKPTDWDDTEPPTIKDPNAKMPTGWLIDESKYIADPNESKPDDWDDELDGEWSPSMVPNPLCTVGCGPWTTPEITNPKYKGKWSPPLIDNPAYKGSFEPRKIKNPDYFYDSEPYKMTDISSITFELWIVTGGVGFDNLLISDDLEYSNNFASKLISQRRNVYRIKKIKEIATSKLTLQISSGIFGGIVFIFFIYHIFFRKSKTVKPINPEQEGSKLSEHKDENEEKEIVEEESSDNETSKDE